MGDERGLIVAAYPAVPGTRFPRMWRVSCRWCGTDLVAGTDRAAAAATAQRNRAARPCCAVFEQLAMCDHGGL